jgi:6-phosphogluconolactonase
MLLSALPSPAAAENHVYISLAGENRIAIYRQDPADGKLIHAGETAVAGAPGALAVDPDRKYLFASLRSISSLASFRIDPATGALTPMNMVTTPGADAAFVGVDRSGRYLLSAYYTAGKVMVHAIGPDGKLEQQPRAEVVTAKNAHLVMTDPKNRFVFVPHTGPNAIFQFALDARTGSLTPNAVPKVQTPDNTGPRHLRFHRGGRKVYVANEQGSSVTGYDFEPAAGTLTPFQTLSTLPDGFTGDNTCAEVQLHPSGKFVYVSNRGHDSLACYSLDRGGRLTRTGHAATEKTPRSFDLDPEGRFAYAAGQASTRVTGYRIDARTGLLERLQTYEVGRQPSWVLVVSPAGR